MSTDDIIALRLSTALIGGVTPNLRRAAFERTDDGLIVRFLLDHDDPVDREEIEDAVFEFEAMQETDEGVSVEVVCDRRPLREVPFTGRVVYARREE